MEDIEFPRACGQMWHALDSGCTCTDDRHALVSELIEAAKRTAAGVIVIPPTRMESVSRVGVDPRYAWELGTIERAI